MEKTIIISNRAGLHARPSALVVELTKKYNADIYFEKDDNRVNAKSIIGLFTLGATYGTKLKIIAEGEDGEDAVNALVHLFDSKFEED
jgi:phosphocarrier protein